MAKGDHTDLFMIFNDKNGKPIVGESQADITSSDELSKKLLEGFKTGFIFEIESFSLSAQDNTKDEADIRKELTHQNAQTNKPQPGAKPGAEQTPPMTPQKFEDEVKKRVAKNKAPPIEPITFKRTLDSSSGPFLTTLKLGQGYKSASLIKRKSTGGKTASGLQNLAADVYLRIDFDMVLVTDISLDDDDEEVSENTTFVCRKITIRYRPQLPSGKLGAVISGGWEWTVPAPGSLG